ncbi:4Fe-4S dicluster domain-containing protein [bacterium]|nr:4Fe-4S dicluster domain-containing protein [bacterium]
MADNHDNSSMSRRAFLSGLAILSTACPAQAQKQFRKYTAPPPQYKKPYPRQEYITPPGSQSHSHFQRLCTGCHLCVSGCPNHVLTSHASPLTNMAQPVLTYERGFCKPGCTRCSHTCPTGAILPINREEKSSLQIGQAVFNLQHCVTVKDGVHCGLCARRCPAGAITMVNTEYEGRNIKVPAINASRCIGCGACEYYCPATPLSAIHVEGVQVQRTI